MTRIRLGLEGAWRGIGSIVPSFEIGARQDGGDAETGFGGGYRGRARLERPGAGDRSGDPRQGSADP